MIKKLARAALLGLFVLAASCASLIGSDDYEGAGSALCSTLELCYGDGVGDCEARIDQRLERSPGALRQRWLEYFSDFDCLSSCAAARRCLDFEPVCALKGECETAEECCGFVKGKAACGKAGGGANCCVTRGSECQSDKDCCDALCLPAAVDKTTCGGVVCKEAPEPCKEFFECCSGICKNGQCAEEVCGETGFPCQEGLDCCSGICQESACADLPCPQLGEACNDDCCDGAACVPTLEPGVRVCTPPSCNGLLPDGADCLLDDQCCSGHCREGFGVCTPPCPVAGQACPDGECCEGLCVDGSCLCLGFGESCDNHADCCQGRCDFTNANGPICACSNDICDDNADCCSGVCIGGACSLECIPSGSITCHDECALGGPLNADVCTEPADLPGCIQSVCGQDPYCCCLAWDEVCVGHASALCGTCN